MKHSDPRVPLINPRMHILIHSMLIIDAYPTHSRTSTGSRVIQQACMIDEGCKEALRDKSIGLASLLLPLIDSVTEGESSNSILFLIFF